MKPENPSPAAHIVRYGVAIAHGGFRVFLRHVWTQTGISKDPTRGPKISEAFDTALQKPETFFALAKQPWTGALARGLRRVARLFADEGLTLRFAESKAGAALAPVLNAFAPLCAEVDRELETSGFAIRINESDAAILESLYPHLPQFAVDSGIGPARAWLPALFTGLMNASLWREIAADPQALNLTADLATEFFANLFKDTGVAAPVPAAAAMEQAITAFAPKTVDAAISHLTWMLEPAEAVNFEARVIPFLRAAFALDTPPPPVVAPVAPPPIVAPPPPAAPVHKTEEKPSAPLPKAGPAVDSLASMMAGGKAEANAASKPLPQPVAVKPTTKPEPAKPVPKFVAPAVVKPASVSAPGTAVPVPKAEPKPGVIALQKSPQPAAPKAGGVAVPPPSAAPVAEPQPVPVAAARPVEKQDEKPHGNPTAPAEKPHVVESSLVPAAPSADAPAIVVSSGVQKSALAVVPPPPPPPVQPLRPVSKPAPEPPKSGVQPIIPPRDEDDDLLEDVEKAAVRDVRWLVGGVGIVLVAITLFAVFGRGFFGGSPEAPIDGPAMPSAQQPAAEPVKQGPEKMIVAPVEPLAEPVSVAATPIVPGRLFEQAQTFVESAGRAKASGDNRQAAEDLSRVLLIFKQELGDARWKEARYTDLRNQYRSQLELLEFSKEQISAIEETLGAREPVEPEPTGEPGLAKMTALFKRGDEEVTNNRPRAAAEAYESGLRSGMEVLGEKHLTDRVYQAHLSRYIDFLISENLDPDELASRLLLVKKGKKPAPLPVRRTEPESGGLGLPKL